MEIKTVGEEPGLLRDLFPHFWFTAGAETFLKKSATQDIEAQLLERQIREVLFVPTAIQGRTEVIDSGFRIFISERLAIDDQALVLGHEIARTFQFNLTHQPPIDTMSDERKAIMELFCDEFALRWLDQNNPHKILTWLEAKQELVAH